MEGADDSGHGKSTVSKPLQGYQQRLQLDLVLPWSSPPLVFCRREDDTLRVGRQSLVIVAEVEPTTLPSLFDEVRMARM